MAKQMKIFSIDVSESDENEGHLIDMIKADNKILQEISNLEYGDYYLAVSESKIVCVIEDLECNRKKIQDLLDNGIWHFCCSVIELVMERKAFDYMCTVSMGSYEMIQLT